MTDTQIDNWEARAKAAKSLAQTLRKLAVDEPDRERKAKLLDDSAWYDAWAQRMEDMSFDQSN